MIRKPTGLSLLELLVSLAIISVILVAIISFYGSFIRLELKNQVRTKLKLLAQREMERLLSLSYNSFELDALGNNSGRINFFESEEGEYIVKTKVIYLDPETGAPKDTAPLDRSEDPKLKEIIVSVARKDGLVGQIDMINFKSP